MMLQYNSSLGFRRVSGQYRFYARMRKLIRDLLWRNFFLF